MTEEYVLKLSGKVSIPKPLNIGHNWHVSLQGSITGETRDDNNDGTMEVGYRFPPVIVEVLTPKGEVIKAKDKRKMSQKLRGRLFMIHSESESLMPFDDWYDLMMGKIIQKVDELITY